MHFRSGTSFRRYAIILFWGEFMQKNILFCAIIIIFFSNAFAEEMCKLDASSSPDVKYSATGSKCKTYNSLPNGTVLNSEPLYLNGMGYIMIENGTDSDALAKLVLKDPNRSVYTVYIKAGETCKISKISDGIYELFFSHGKDWNKENQKFLVNKSYSKFEETFKFVTRTEQQANGVRRTFSTFKVTLHPVTGGSAKTDAVSEEEFNKF